MPIQSTVSIGAAVPRRPPLLNHDRQRHDRLLPVRLQQRRGPRRPHHHRRRTTLHSRHAHTNDHPAAQERGTPTRRPQQSADDTPPQYVTLRSRTTCWRHGHLHGFADVSAPDRGLAITYRSIYLSCALHGNRAWAGPTSNAMCAGCMRSAATSPQPSPGACRSSTLACGGVGLACPAALSGDCLGSAGPSPRLPGSVIGGGLRQAGERLGQPRDDVPTPFYHSLLASGGQRASWPE
jgi:hypothetical protein